MKNDRLAKSPELETLARSLPNNISSLERPFFTKMAFHDTIKNKVSFLLICLLMNTIMFAYYPFNGNASDENPNGNHGTVISGTLAPTSSKETKYTYEGDGKTIKSKQIIQSHATTTYTYDNQGNPLEAVTTEATTITFNEGYKKGVRVRSEDNDVISSNTVAKWNKYQREYQKVKSSSKGTKHVQYKYGDDGKTIKNKRIVQRNVTTTYTYDNQGNPLEAVTTEETTIDSTKKTIVRIAEWDKLKREYVVKEQPTKESQ